MTRFNNDYNPTSGNDGSNSGSGDYKDRDPMLMGQYAIITFELAKVGEYAGQYGQSMILNMDNVDVHEGVVTERLDDEKVKVFGWDRWFNRDEETMELEPLPGSDTISADDLPSVESQSAGGDTYRYAIQDPVLEDEDEPVSVGDMDLWLSNGKKARTLAKVLSEKGHNIIDEENSKEDTGWLTADDGGFQLRDELQGRRLMMWFERVTIPADDLPDDQDEAITFTDTVLLDAETESPITIKNDEGDENEVNDTASESQTADSTTDDTPTAEADGGYPKVIQDLVEMFQRNGQTNRDAIETMIRDEEPDGYSVDMDAVMADITGE